MRATPKWREWVAGLSPQRLRSLLNDIETHELVIGQLTEPDIFLRKLLTEEMDKRYA